MANIPRVFYAKMQIDCHCMRDILYDLSLLEPFVLLAFFMSNCLTTYLEIDFSSPPFFCRET